ncbi:cyclic pyranopterin monophosphate synthase MoaC [Sulfidibacter corallicola]|uniref:Cyclic pyranopterin monophosphate synthase n=1 Tax=Sulfidibacter corallicola TaxID=2818388 RepID=A0A8A4TUL6_SULCO|nr:cyclic pyranopterin monophosphate synthase MoaC [Sulfidibacter corallicola]QTD52828.1 cyclic pyranopterin monophosphate synthase MoaC [Sulfidibacter corallicola]
MTEPYQTAPPDGEASGLTHLNAKGEARMVDVGAKAVTERRARAEGFISMPRELIERLDRLKKGNAYEIARLAGIMAAKKTHDLIPLCHVLPLDFVGLQFESRPEEGRVRVESEVRVSARTGVEMEALTAVQVALLTLYDMGKSVTKGMVIGPVRLLHKSGGKSGDWRAASPEP